MSKNLFVRMSEAQKLWLQYQAFTTKRTLNASILALIDAAMNVDPLLVFVHRVQLFDQAASYVVTLGEQGEEEFESPDRDQALAFALRRLNSLGLPRTAARFNGPLQSQAL